jgi:hypothetical protein
LNFRRDQLGPGWLATTMTTPLDDMSPTEREAVLAIDQLAVLGLCAIVNGPDVASARRVIDALHARIGKEIPLFADYIARREGRLRKRTRQVRLSRRARSAFHEMRALCMNLTRPPMKVSSTSTSPDNLSKVPSCIASRIRWSMNHAVFCVTLMARWIS